MGEQPSTRPHADTEEPIGAISVYNVYRNNGKNSTENVDEENEISTESTVKLIVEDEQEQTESVARSSSNETMISRLPQRPSTAQKKKLLTTKNLIADACSIFCQSQREFKEIALEIECRKLEFEQKRDARKEARQRIDRLLAEIEVKNPESNYKRQKLQNEIESRTAAYLLAEQKLDMRNKLKERGLSEDTIESLLLKIHSQSD